MKKNEKATNIAKIILLSMLLGIIIVISVLLVIGSDSKEEPYVAPTTTEDINIKNMYSYFMKNEKNFKASFKYIEETDSIQVTFNNIESDHLKNVFVKKDEETNSIYLKDSNDNIYLVDSDWIFRIPLPDGTGSNYVYATLSKAINSYQESIIEEDLGDAKDYGEDATITTNPDGSLGIGKD